MDLSKFEPVSHKGVTNEWFTPKLIFSKCGDFDLDPCGSIRWPIAKKTYYKDGLEKKWFGRVWLNPPYGNDIYKWTEKIKIHNNGLLLVYNRSDTKWFQNIAIHATWILFLKGRVRFVRSDSLKEAKRSGGSPSVLMAFGLQERPKLKGIYLKQF
jgi:hypothetical protein